MALRGKAGATLAGRYRLLEQLGEGGMGSVWKAEHLLLHSHVAVKIVDPDVARLEFNLARFLREAKTLATLRSPHVVQVLDFGSDGDTPYLVMELLHGQTLGRRLAEQGRLTLRETCRVLRDVCAAMSLVHDQGLIHRDLKPENIFLCNVAGQHVTKVVDFGIAKSLRGDMTASMKTRTGHMLGTPSYMSPEQCRGLKDIDHRADLWALGVIAYECLVGKVPFEGEVLGDLLLRICMDPLPIPSQRAHAALPPAFDAWFAKAVHRDRTARFQSARELAIALSELAPAPSEPMHKAPEPSRPSVSRVSFVPPIPVPRPATNTETNTSVGLVRSARRGERRARAAAVSAVALVTVFGVWAFGKQLDPDLPVDVEVESLRPAYEVAPKVINPRVPTGRRWLPSGVLPASAGVQPSGALLEGSLGAGDDAIIDAPGALSPEAAPGAELAKLVAPPAAAAAARADVPPAPSPAALPAIEAGGGVASTPVAAHRSPVAGSAPAGQAAGAGARPATGAAAAAPSGAPSATPPAHVPVTTAPAVSPGEPPAAPAPPAEKPPAAAPPGERPPAAAPPAAAPQQPPAEKPPAAAPPAAAPPVEGPPAEGPRPSHGRQLSPPPASPRPLRGTAAPAAPSRARATPPADDSIRHAR